MTTVAPRVCAGNLLNFRPSFSVLSLACCALLLLGMLCSSASAGFIGSLATGPPADNDNNISEINAIITAYNTVNMTTLPLLVDPPDPLLTKTDDSDFDTAFLSDFMFFSDAAGTTMLNSAAEIHAESMVWFKYTGTANILYYTVKGGKQGYNAYQYMAVLNSGDPLNKAEQPSGGGISHISFWTGSTVGNVVPELGTWSMSLAALVIAALAVGVSRHRPATQAVAVR